MMDHAALEDLLQQQLAWYQAALEVAAQVTQSLDQGNDPTSALEELQRLMDEVFQLQQEVRSLHPPDSSPTQADSGAAVSQANWKATAKRLEEVLVALIEQVAAAEHKAREAKARLQPQLTQATRQRQMRRAYQSSYAAEGAE